ncbi:TDR15 protein, partial [Urocolius indicus]|nr:TDR15 protein [Urocolius indicus]
WCRGIVVGKREDFYEVYLIDTGQVLKVEGTHLASACDEFFQLPPKVILGVFASILPLEEKWSPKAMNYFSSLIGLQVRGHVKAVVPYQLFILKVPKIISDVLELQLGKHIDEDSFCLIVETLRAFPREMICKKVPQLLQQKRSVKEFLTFSNSGKSADFWPVPDNLFRHLPVGSKENVKITAAVSPNKFYCQIQKWQKELEDLTGAMCLYYEAISTENKKSFESLGLLCAAKRQNGQWHRGVIKQVLSDHVEIWFMDFGNIEAVPSSCVQRLKVEFMALPMISFPCALSCFGCQDETVIKTQLKRLTKALIAQTPICAQVDLFSDVKHLYYITLQNHNLEINAKHVENVKEAAASCITRFETKITSMALNDKPCHERCSSLENFTGNNHAKKCLTEWAKFLPSHFKRVEMQVNTYCCAFVVYVLNPSHFWIQTCEYEREFQALMKDIAEVYEQREADKLVLKSLEPGLVCCAQYSKDMHYYRAVVVEVLDVNITVYFFDFGNTDTVPCYNVKTLLPVFSDLPALAVCCGLACTPPVEDFWAKKDTDFFRGIVSNKLLLLHVIGKENDRCIVNVRYTDDLQLRSVATCMAQAGHAQYCEKIPDSVVNLAKKSRNRNLCNLEKMVNAQSICNNLKNEVPGKRQRFWKDKSSGVSSMPRESVVLSCFGKGAVAKRSKSVREEKIFYKSLVFKPGTICEVVCSCVVSPTNFFCQLQTKLPLLDNLMDQIQTFYKENNCPYKTGQIACVVKCRGDGKWYRATVVQRVSTSEADVVFVDYGFQKRVLLEDLQAVHPSLLTLESQAFRCRLKNLPLQIDSLNCPEEMCKHFEDFISTSRGPLTCIIYAVILVSPNSLCNIVDLNTPCISAGQFLREQGLNQSGDTHYRNLASLGSLYSFCYSSFNIKIGSEEEIYITHIQSLSEFYCQLNRNTETIEKLMKEVSVVSKMSNNAKYDTSKTRICIARYLEDGNFYRALASPVESTSYLLADFVDYGNENIIERDQFLPIPDFATDLLFTPMQAIRCCLSDLRETTIPTKVTRWFKEAFLGKLLKAVFVSRESDGQIVVELYDGQLKVNQTIKEKIWKELAVKNRMQQCCYQTDKGQNFGHEERMASSTQKLCSGSSKLLTIQDSEESGFRSTVSVVLENREEPLVGEPASHSLCHPALNSKETAVTPHFESHKEILNCTGQEESSNENISKSVSIPQCDIQVDSEVAGYISHINSPSGFYVHLTEDQNFLKQLAKKLNEGMVSVEAENCLDELMVGDLLVAERNADSFYCRAVVKTLRLGNCFEVEFMDYGSVVAVSPSKVWRILKKFLALLRLSIHCFLRRPKSVPDGSWTSCLVSKINKPIAGKFLQQYGEQWEVDVTCDEESM